MTPDKAVEPWLRGTLTDVEPVRRQVLHALELAGEDVQRWCATLTAEQLHSRPYGLPSVAFHLRHIARSLDRLLTYTEGEILTAVQSDALAREMDGLEQRDQLLEEFTRGLTEARARILAIAPEHFNELRGVGGRRLQVPVAGLLIHCAEHTQRHAGQLVTTAKLVQALAVGS